MHDLLFDIVNITMSVASYYSPDAIYRRSVGKVLNGSVAAVSLPPKLMIATNEENQRAWDAYEERSLANLTPRICVHDAANVMYRVLTCFQRNPKDISVKTVLVDDDRLRGVGVILIATSLAALSVVLLT